MTALRRIQRKGTTAEHATFTGAQAEITVDTDKNTAVVHDGVTPGGIPLAKESVVVNVVNWLVEQDGNGDLLFSNGGVAKMKLTAAGDLLVVGDVKASSTL